VEKLIRILNLQYSKDRMQTVRHTWDDPTLYTDVIKGVLSKYRCNKVMTIKLFCDIKQFLCHVTACLTGTYGSDCVQTCANCNGRQCDTDSGNCLSGCKSGWFGDMCDGEKNNSIYGNHKTIHVTIVCI
jgi:hypothetical protein